jgi:hypothetical protein
VAVPPDERGTWLGVHDAVKPVGEILVPILTVPTNPPKLEILSVTVPEEPAGNVKEVTLGDRPKSTTLIVRVTLCDREPLVAMTRNEYDPGATEPEPIVRKLVAKLPDTRLTLPGLKVGESGVEEVVNMIGPPNWP